MVKDRLVVVSLAVGPVVALVTVPRRELVGICGLDLAHVDLAVAERQASTTSERVTSGTVLPVSRRGDQLVITNRKARHDYHVLDTWEAGIMLAGPEVKSMREGRANLQDSYARMDDDELWLLGMHVSPYAYSREDLDPVRKRKLLLHRKEIVQIERALNERGTTLVPLRVYFKDGRAKVEIALARGKRDYDKRQALAERDAKREAERAMKGIRE
jgi:SsrA-binding protein